ncbi:MAG: hypothetical protein ACLFRY_00240 [Spirochaetia bacterium]
MLHDPSSYTPPLEISEIDLTGREKDVLKRLGLEIAEISCDPVNKEREHLWTRLNDRDSIRPMVWINEIPWHEMNVDDELTLECSDAWARELETRLRREIYQWKHMQGDMVVSDFIACPLAIHSTDFGIIEDVDLAVTDESSDIVSRHFNIQIREPEDIEKIRMPAITHSEKSTEVVYGTMRELFDGIIPVKKVGQTHIWYTPWDYLIRWWGIQEAMMDLVMRPEMVHDAYERMVRAWMTELDQFVEMNLLSLDCNNTRVGSGGYGYTSELPGEPYDPDHVKPHNMWGCSNAQIFSEVSPEMHWEFALEHDLKWLKRWGLTYYGCCEPLHKKMHLLRKIPNLRKISASPWIDVPTMMNEAGTDYVISFKPNPAKFTSVELDEDACRRELEEVIEAGEGKAHIEFIMKDISTVKYRPQNLWRWTDIAMEVVDMAGNK